MRIGKREIIVVGDRVLIRLDETAGKSPAGLYLPPTVLEKEEVRGGVVVEVGPGIPLSDPTNIDDKPWEQESTGKMKYIPSQAEIGDYALFLKKASVEIKIDNKKYLILPQAAILVLVREDIKEQIS